MTKIEVIELGVNKFYIPNRAIIRESYKWKIYLPQSYKDVWEQIRLNKKKVDVIVIIKDGDEK